MWLGKNDDVMKKIELLYNPEYKLYFAFHADYTCDTYKG